MDCNKETRWSICSNCIEQEVKPHPEYERGYHNGYIEGRNSILEPLAELFAYHTRLEHSQGTLRSSSIKESEAAK